jgi:hypothetical protein
MVSPIDHVVMNHQIKLELMANGIMFTTVPKIAMATKSIYPK